MMRSAGTHTAAHKRGKPAQRILSEDEADEPTLKERRMLVTTTTAVEGRRVREYRGLVMGEAILGANVFRDFFAGIRDIVGGRSGGYEKALREARRIAVHEMESEAAELGANAIIGVDIDYETVGENGSMLMISTSGTAVILE
jgi:uncharacterized protein YbjQ (UPF0145 family)